MATRPKEDSELFIQQAAPRLISQQTDKFCEKQYPRCTVQKKVKPVQGANQPTLKQHLQLFPYMRGIERSQSQGQTGYNENGKWYFIKKVQQFVSENFRINIQIA